MGERVLVTGGNGHLGNTLAKALCTKGYQVRVSVRDPGAVHSEGIFNGYDIQLHQADMRDAAAMETAMRGVAGVFQVAALYNYDEQSLGEGIVANNTEGSQTVLRLAKKCGVKRVIFTSSIAAVGFGGTAQVPLTEENWSDSSDPYCRSKLESERAAWRYAASDALELVALCPGIILGPNFYKHTPSTVNIAAFVNNQVPFRLPMQLSIVDVRDVAEAHILAYEIKQAAGRYLVAGTNIVDLLDQLKALDPDMVMPDRMLTQAEALQFAEKAGMPTELVGQAYLFSDQKIQRELGWRARPIAETLGDTISWIKDRDL